MHTRNKTTTMHFSKRITRKLISTWPQRLALSGVIGFIVWNFSGQNLFTFISVMLVSQLVLSLLNSRIPEVGKSYNEEMKY